LGLPGLTAVAVSWYSWVSHKSWKAGVCWLAQPLCIQVIVNIVFEFYVINLSFNCFPAENSRYKDPAAAALSSSLLRANGNSAAAAAASATAATTQVMQPCVPQSNRSSYHLSAGTATMTRLFIALIIIIS
jgi:hypothetical protein